MMRLLLLSLALLAPLAYAETLTGRVVGIADGDTITVLDASNQQHRIRLYGIDAPEKKQPFGSRAKQNLGSLAFGKDATVEWTKLDRYGRIVGKVIVDGQDVGLQQLQAGLAWWYRQYAREQSPQDRAAYSRAEDEARIARVGLWGDPIRSAVGVSKQGCTARRVSIGTRPIRFNELSFHISPVAPKWAQAEPPAQPPASRARRDKMRWKDCGTFAGISPARSCTVQQRRQRTPRKTVVKSVN